MPEIRPATLRDLSYVTANLRKEDRRELMCQYPEDTTTTHLAYFCSRAADHAYTVWYKDNPVAAFGTALAGPPTLRIGWAFGTRQFRRAVPCISRFMIETLGPALVEEGVRRVEVRAIQDHDLAHKWLTSLGARAETVLDEFGSHGEKFVQYAWLAKDFMTWRARNV